MRAQPRRQRKTIRHLGRSRQIKTEQETHGVCRCVRSLPVVAVVRGRGDVRGDGGRVGRVF